MSRKAWNKINFSKDDVIKIKNLYSELKSTQKVANIVGVSKTTIRKVLKENGVDLKTCKKTQEEKELVISLYKENGSVKEISRKTGFKIETINKILGRLKQIYYKPYIYKNKYSYDKDIFEVIDTAEKSYWFGFLMADGCIIDSKGYPCTLSIGLQILDKDHVEKFADFIHCEHEAIKCHDDHVSFSVSSKKMCEDLVKHGCVPRKSLIAKFPSDVPECFYRDFIRGYFDGDGSFYKRSNGRYGFSIVGTPEMILSIKSFLLDNNDITDTKIYNITDRTCEYKKEGKQAIQLAKYLYEDANVYLNRKYQKVCPFIQ